MKAKALRDNGAHILKVRSRGEKICFGIVFFLFSLYALSLILPFVFLIINSLKGGMEYIDHMNSGNMVKLPSVWHFENYIKAFNDMSMLNSLGQEIRLPMMFFNSLWYCTVSTVSGVFASALTAYVLSKYKFTGRGFFYGIAIFSMTIPVIGTTAAMFKLVYTLQIYNTPILPLLLNFAGFGFNFLILYGFFSNLPWSYVEAVFIDGGGHATAFFRVMLPQAFPCLLTLFIMAFITNWNDYTTLLLYMPDHPTLASGLYVVEQSIRRDGLKYPEYFAGLIIAIVPILILFSVFSETIMSNFSVGGLKG